ncbi:MAG: methyltransferase [Prolixibacteraceae bacterium]|nr:methyltransferase [Prolixibacteraceae bacterium]
MGRNNYFQFKQFNIIQEDSAMKVGTDGVLVGAWVNVSREKNILDVGTGTGVIALMMAQRCNANITAIEIEKKSFGEACFNFSQSQWTDRIKPVYGSFQDFCSDTNEKFDLIISNPPFFENASKAAEQNRSNARHTDLLPFDELIIHCSKILAENGRLSVIIPAFFADQFISLASENKLNVSRLTKVRPKPEKPFHRFLIEFSRGKTIPAISELTIETNSYQIYTPEYKNLTKDFYLAF